MTQDELVNLGKVLRAVSELTGEVRELRREVKILRKATDENFEALQAISKFVHGLSCVSEETPREPLSTRAVRQSLASMSDDEPDSVLTRELSAHAGPIAVRGPGIMVAIMLLVGGAVAGVLMWFRKKLFGL